jgi:hypothetical protein
MTYKYQRYPRKGSMVKGYQYDAPISFNKYGHLASGSIPVDCIQACSASGSVDYAVALWVDRLGLCDALAERRDLVVRYLLDFGAWDDLESADIGTLAERVLWIACGDIAEQGEWYGICH